MRALLPDYSGSLGGAWMNWRWLPGGRSLYWIRRWNWSLSMCLSLCLFGCRLVLALPGAGDRFWLSATHAGGRMLWCSARRAYVGFTIRVVVLSSVPVGNSVCSPCAVVVPASPSALV
jgi:hypothetical protein